MRKTDNNVNGVRYRRPTRPTVVICMDGISVEYINKAIDAGKASTLKRFQKKGFFSTAEGVIPSLTNPNNIGTITGAPPRTHGIVTSGISFNRKRWDYELIDSPKYIKCGTFLQAFSDAGINVASITAKDKLRHFLSSTNEHVNISAEMAHTFKDDDIGRIIKKSILVTRKIKLLNAVDSAWMYSEQSSHYALDLTVALLQGKGPYLPEVVYVSLTDYIPHRNEPGTAAANRYINGIDERLEIIDSMGCIVWLTADHGMNNKHNPDSSPRAIWLKDILDKEKISDYRILLPITDKYVAHHSCLGSCAWIYFRRAKDREVVFKVLQNVAGIDEVLFNEDVEKKYGLPGDLIGDLFILADKKTVFGTTRSEHRNVPSGLRSHGGRHELETPFIMNKPLNRIYGSKDKSALKNYNILEYAINEV